MVAILVQRPGDGQSRTPLGARDTGVIRIARKPQLALRRSKTEGDPAQSGAAREETKRLYLRCVNVIRINENVDSVALIAVGLKPRKDRRQARSCPQEPPYLQFVQALHAGNSASPMHELSFYPMYARSKCKPAGAARLELFVDLIPPGEAVPQHPGANLGGRPWYLRSYTRSPIKLAPPICRVPMLVVYWGRWADATGSVGPFCGTVVSRIEGWSPHTEAPVFGSNKRAPILEDATASGPAGRERRYSVAVLDAQYQSLHRQDVPPAQPAQRLPAPAEREAPRLEGPGGEAERANEAA